MTERLHFHFSLSCIGEGNGNPLQCSCLENPRDGGAWWAAIYGVTQSRTQLMRLSSSSSSSLYVSAITALVQPLVDSYLDYRNSPWIDFFVSWLSFPVGTCFHCHQSNRYKITLDFAILLLKKPPIADSSELPVWGSNVWASCIQGLSWSAPCLIH